MRAYVSRAAAARVKFSHVKCVFVCPSTSYDVRTTCTRRCGQSSSSSSYIIIVIITETSTPDRYYCDIKVQRRRRRRRRRIIRGIKVRFRGRGCVGGSRWRGERLVKNPTENRVSLLPRRRYHIFSVCCGSFATKRKKKKNYYYNNISCLYIWKKKKKRFT